MEHQRPRTWTARLAIAALCGLLVALVSLVGYEPSPRNADAAIQPAPTSIAFVPLHPDPPVQVRALQAGRMMSLPETTSELIAPAGGPEQPAALLPDPAACSFPCFDPDAKTEPVEDEVVDLGDDFVQLEVPNEASPNEASPNEASPNEASPNEASPNEASPAPVELSSTEAD